MPISYLSALTTFTAKNTFSGLPYTVGTVLMHSHYYLFKINGDNTTTNNATNAIELADFKIVACNFRG